jgi:hypothetical protein
MRQWGSVGFGRQRGHLFFWPREQLSPYNKTTSTLLRQICGAVGQVHYPYLIGYPSSFNDGREGLRDLQWGTLSARALSTYAD